MAALAADYEIHEKEGNVIEMPVVASDIIYKGAMVKINAAGYAEPMAAEAGAFMAGIALEQQDNSSGSAGDLDVLIRTEGVFLMTSAGLAQADVGSLVYASDDQTVSTVQGANEIQVGRIVKYVSATQAWVKINCLAA